jgi:DNA-directed RNA polymerase specialized sigma subunit
MKTTTLIKNVAHARPNVTKKRRTKQHPSLTKEQKKLVEEHLWVAGYAAYRVNSAKWGNTGALVMEDLVQVARFALCVAAVQFNPDRGVKFSTYACNKAQGYLQHALRDKSRMVRTPRWVEGIRNKVKDMLKEGKTYAEIAEELGIKEDKVAICHMAEQNYHLSYDSGPEDWTSPEFVYEEDPAKSVLRSSGVRDIITNMEESEVDLLVRYTENPNSLKEDELKWAILEFERLRAVAFGENPDHCTC